MNNLLLQISRVPQSVQDIIGMYNVEHRTKMKLVLEELEVVCETCGDYICKFNSFTFIVYDLTFCNTGCARCCEHYDIGGLRWIDT